ncbi:hypothetical protein E4U55_003615 [Claviceps digitariae]|nr:hypothetical protein E4U55_003615 [Claviceps digitariae]
MSSLTMAAPSPHHTFNNDSRWNMPRPAPGPARPRIESQDNALPSIRQTFPDLHLDGSFANVAANLPSLSSSSSTSSSYYKPSPSSNAGPQILPGYVHSPNVNKKGHHFNETEHESLRVKQVPRLYHSPEASRRIVSPPYRDQAPLPPRDHWVGSPEYGVGGSTLLPPVEMAIHSGRHPDCSNSLPRPREHVVELINMPMSSEFGRGTPAFMDRPSPQDGLQEYGYSYHHPSRYHSLSTSSIRTHDQTTYSGGATYGVHLHDGRYIDIGIGGDTKQRKRRGNLPKETTDKLRTWFVAHLHHPYPTEDEKQDLMRQTGLQMNQISNWFINARRRQLPTMINNARAESEAVSTRSLGGIHGGGSVLRTTENAAEYSSRRHDGFSLSDGEDGAYEDDVHTLHQSRGGNMERESV